MQQIRVSVPGSIMLMGEHSVLFGEKALACAVDKRIEVLLEPRPGSQVSIDSALAQYCSDLAQLADEPKLSFVICAIKVMAPQLPSGFSLRIRSEFSHTVGLGSSAAVTAGVVAALLTFAKVKFDLETLFAEALKVVHRVQNGRGSGTDLVASIFGSSIAYRVKPREITALPNLPSIGLYYCGYKTKTADVLKQVEGFAQNNPSIYAHIYQLMGKVTDAAEQAIMAQDWRSLGALMNNYQGLMDALGVADKALCEMVYSLRNSQHIYGAKISGSGLGDCVLSLGTDPDMDWAYEQIPVAVSKEGVIIEYN